MCSTLQQVGDQQKESYNVLQIPLCPYTSGPLCLYTVDYFPRNPSWQEEMTNGGDGHDILTLYLH